MHSPLSLGFSLFEVLVSLILLSIALLGLDVMEVFALHKNINSYQAGIAEQQLQNIEERLRMIGSRGDPYQQEVLWNKENQLVLPQAKGRVRGVYPHYSIRLSWGVRGDSKNVKQGGSHAGCLFENFSL